MTPERYQQIKAVFQAALERDSGERSRFIAAACADDPALQCEVERLLGSYAEASDVIDQLADEVSAKLHARSRESGVVGLRIGPYEVVDELGRGGMGTVYLAVRADDEYRKQVAIKLIKRGMDTDAIVRRFLGERQILADLDHPNIARLLDGGTTEDGLPYFVMEHIEGLPIDQYCDAHRLSTLERLRLFRDVCSAVLYAHQNLIIHRDIKPSNILVNQAGMPKLLDFGIAKLLGSERVSESVEATATALRVMTPEYASPEQAHGHVVTTATDVYSLGVVLYELLTGHRPYRLKHRLPTEIAEAICLSEPERPSAAVGRIETVESDDNATRISITPELVSQARSEPTDRLRRRLAGDLDNIVLMAMRKEAHRRYSSVDQLSEDIRRYLDGRPVSARKDTFAYRSAKFIKRNKFGVAAAVLVALTLLGGIVATTWQARVARSQRTSAEQRFNDVRQLANAVLFKYHDAIENLPGATPAREMLVRDALDYLDRLSHAGGDGSLQRELATAYLKVGDVQGKRYASNLGDTSGALESYRKAEAILESLSAADPADTLVRLDLSRAYENIGNLLASSINGPEAVAYQEKALAIREALLTADPTNRGYKQLLSTSYLYLGDAMGSLIANGDETTHRRLEVYRKSLAIRDELAAADPSNLPARRDVAQICQRIGGALGGISQITGNADYLRSALESNHRALAIREAIAALDSTNARDRRHLADQQMLTSDTLVALGDTAKALEGYRKAEAIFESLSAIDPTNAEARRDIAYLNERFGAALAKQGDARGAVESWRKAAHLFEALHHADPTRSEDFGSALQVYDRVIELRVKQGELGRVIETYNRQRTIIDAALKHNQADYVLAHSASIDAKLAFAYTTFAARNGLGHSQQIEYWTKAYEFYRRSRETRFLQQENEALTAEVNRLVAEIARCEAALAKLQASRPSAAKST